MISAVSSVNYGYPIIPPLPGVGNSDVGTVNNTLNIYQSSMQENLILLALLALSKQNDNDEQSQTQKLLVAAILFGMLDGVYFDNYNLNASLQQLAGAAMILPSSYTSTAAAGQSSVAGVALNVMA